MLAVSPMNDFFDGLRTDRRVSDQPAVAFDGVTFILLEGGAIAAGFASESRRPIHLRRVIIWMGALRFVRAIRSKAFSGSSLLSIVIPRTVEIIGSFCFSACKSLSSVLIESGSLLRRIEPSAFSNSSLPSIVIPRTVEIIDGSAFSNCEGLLISIEEGSEHLAIDGYFLQSFDRSILIRYFGCEDIVCIPRTVEIIGSYCFENCSSLSSVSIESGSLLRRIESGAFSFSSLRSIVIPRTVEIIGSFCFRYCKSLSSVLIESSSLLRRIEYWAFSNSSLPSIVIPRTVEIVHGSIFSYCKGLLISIEEGSEHLAVDDYFLQSFDRSVLIQYFGREDIVCILRAVEIIGSSCFHGCKSLLSFSIESGSSLRRIESNAFSFSSLTSIVIPRTVEILGSFCFSYCKSLSSVSIESGSSLRQIESGAFSNSSLTSIVIPRTVEIVHGSIFSYCKGLLISIEEGNEQIGRAHV
jgi:predicted transcriptional regulator